MRSSLNEKGAYAMTNKDDQASPLSISGQEDDCETLQMFQFCVEQAPDGLIWLDREARFRYANEQTCRLLGYTREELTQLHAWDVNPEKPEVNWYETWASYRQNDQIDARQAEVWLRRKDGSTFPAEISSKHIWFGDLEFHVAFVRNISGRKREEEERKKLETQLLQAQKMEAIGRLAGGVAHDFNNMLCVILGRLELIKTRFSPADALLRQLADIEKAAIHSRDLTRQLLAYSRNQIITPRVVNLNSLLEETRKTLGLLIREDVELIFHLDDKLWDVNMDPSQVDQVIINLAANARDAMPVGGKLTIETANVDIDPGYSAEHCECAPGAYVRLTVSDSGCGMDSKTLANIFEPFFTTKEASKGTGLGLSMVYGIAKQNGGFINACSEVGRGTIFKAYFPRYVGEEKIVIQEDGGATVIGTETVLLVEDNTMVRDMVESMLQQLGYGVLVAETPADVLTTLERHTGKIDLLLTDVVMPGTKGTELRDKALAIRPGLQVLFMSGYTTKVIVHHGVLEPMIHFIQKPFSLFDLSQKIRVLFAEPNSNRT